MITVDEHLAHADPDLCFRVAADVERWPQILPHYRWVTFRERDGLGRGTVEMAAWRPFGPVGYPTWWLSEMTSDPDRRLVLYRHIGGITRGMDVRWEVSPTDTRDVTRLRIVHEWDGPGWPLIGRLAANLVIGPVFISAIAGRTLAGIAAESERRARDAGGGSA